MTSVRKTIVILSILAGLAVIGVTLVEITSTEAVSGPHAPEPSAVPRPEAEIRAPPIAHDERAGPDDRPAAKSPKPSPDSPSQGSVGQDQVRRTLHEKYGRTKSKQGDEPTATGEQDPPAVPPPSWSSLPEEYVTGILREQLIPVAQSCYEDVAPKGTSGTLTLSVAILGDEDVGGVIDHIDVNHTATSIEGELTDCVQHAAYNMEFAPPDEGQGVQEFDFSIEFSED